MIAKSISFTDYRNLASTEVAFGDGINVLWGNNAQGKSNILEGIYYFARGKSFRGAKDRELIRFGCDFAKLAMNCQREGAKHETKLEITLPQTGRKRITRGGAVVTASEMIGSFRAVLFCPAHLTLVSGGPALRRSFLDIAIAQLSPAYLGLLSRYNRTLDQRNALLKAAADGMYVTKDQWQVYAEQLAAYGAGIASCRLGYMTSLVEKMGGYFAEMTEGREAPALTYVSSAIPDGEADAAGAAISFLSPDTSHGGRDAMIRLLTSEIDREIHAKTTLWGIHKDDVVIKLSDNDARLYASQGQQRSIALAMKLAEGEISKDIGGEYPVFLLDDVLSELDGGRRAYVLGALKDRQIIVTSCEPGLFENVSVSVNMINVKDGTVAQM